MFTIHSRMGRRTVCAAAIAVLGVAGAIANGAEVVVKNDSATDGSTIALQQGIIGGEHAAAWLTSPCNGEIVALQIWWSSPAGGAGPSLEEAITVYAAGTFPNPGAILRNGPLPTDPEAVLLGPVMNDGGLNEFRFLDENMLVPLQIPVTAGQVFVVGFELDSTPGATGPTVATDINGCQAGKNAVRVIPGGFWVNLCAFGASGDWVIRAVVDCQEPTGACCDGDGECMSGVEQGDCQGPGETFFVGQTCQQVTCPEPRGACCNGTGGCVANQTETFCETTLGGIYAGNGTTCGSGVCSLGACCLPDGSCQQLVEAECLDLSGIFRGVGVACVNAMCPQPTGACCIGDICIEDQTQMDCESFPGEWQGVASGCTPDPCTAPSVCGDTDLDGDVDLTDFGVFAQCFGGAFNPPAATCPAGAASLVDCDGDGDIDSGDFAVFGQNFTGSL